MSENFDELGELGDKIKKIIDTAVSTKDYRQMTGYQTDSGTDCK